MTIADGGHVWTASSHGVDWRLELERHRLLPGRLVPGRVVITARSDIQSRGLLVTLLGEEHWKYEVRTTDSKGDSRTETRTGRDDLPLVPVQVSGPLVLGAGETRSFDIEIPVPALGPATVMAETSGVTWSLEAKLDVASGMDPAIDVPVSILQPTALLRAGVVRVGQFAHFEAADASSGDITGEIALDPVPLVCGERFSGRLVLRAPSAIQVQEVRAELRVTAQATVSGGLEETIVPWSARVMGPGEVSGEHEFVLDGEIDDRLLPTIELPHGRASTAFHVIVARAWARDPHLVRDVSMATTAEL
jgi:SpoOM protein